MRCVSLSLCRNKIRSALRIADHADQVAHILDAFEGKGEAMCFGARRHESADKTQLGRFLQPGFGMRGWPHSARQRDFAESLLAPLAMRSGYRTATVVGLYMSIM